MSLKARTVEMDDNGAVVGKYTGLKGLLTVMPVWAEHSITVEFTGEFLSDEVRKGF